MGVLKEPPSVKLMSSRLITHFTAMRVARLQWNTNCISNHPFSTKRYIENLPLENERVQRSFVC